MKRAPLSYRRIWPKEKLLRLREIERAFHVRAFGEELARANLDLPIEERHRYVAEMRELARKARRPRADQPAEPGDTSAQPPASWQRT